MKQTLAFLGENINRENPIQGVNQISYHLLLQINQKLCSANSLSYYFPVVWYLSLREYILVDSKITNRKVLDILETERKKKTSIREAGILHQLKSVLGSFESGAVCVTGWSVRAVQGWKIPREWQGISAHRQNRMYFTRFTRLIVET